MELRGKIALVTGASRGIGRAVALRLARAAADIAVGFSTGLVQAEQTAGEIRRAGVRAVALGANLADADQATRLAEAASKALGEIDILVNNAGVAVARPIGEIDAEFFDETLRVNLRSAFLLTQAVLPAMRRKRWGRIIFIGSTAANVGGIVGPHYAASKAAMVGLMHWYAAHMAAEGITANCVAPALIDTEMLHGNAAARPERIPVGRFGNCEEVADIVAALVANGYVTGQTINVNGGLYPTS